MKDPSKIPDIDLRSLLLNNHENLPYQPPPVADAETKPMVFSAISINMADFDRNADQIQALCKFLQSKQVSHPTFLLHHIV